MFKKILVSTDGSQISNKAVKQAIRIASVVGARLTAVNVVGEYRRLQDEGYLMPAMPELKKRFDDAESARAKKILDAVKKSANAAGVKCEVVMPAGNAPYEAIISQARKSKCDLIVMASHGRRGIQGLLLGSETTKVLTHSKIPVLVCR